MYVGLQARFAVQIVVLGDAPAVREDLRALGVLLRGDVAEFLQQRDVHIGLDVAGDPRVAVPVPGATHVGRPVDQPHTLDTQLAQPRTRQQAAEAGADDRHVNLVGERVAREFSVHPGVLGEPGELARGLDVLCDPVGAQSPRALFGVLLSQRVDVERPPSSLGQGLDFLSVSPTL